MNSNHLLWSPASWQKKTIRQLCTYPDQTKLVEVVKQLSELPPLVTAMEVRRLSMHLKAVQAGKAFILQGGDCAESFADCHAETITNKLKILLQMSLILTHGMKKPVIRIGRIAGQYAKPRSQTQEHKNGIELPAYFGDLMNRPHFSEAARRPDPKRLLQGYHYAIMTLNYIRALIDGGFADLQHPEYWDLDFVQHSPMANQYKQLVDSLGNTLSFIKTVVGIQSRNLTQIDFFTSHEALNLYYEQALTRCESNGEYFNLSTHFPWVGMRTSHPNEAHVEYLRGIANPVAVKIGPEVEPNRLLELIEKLNPYNQTGRLMLIVRLGAENINSGLAPLIKTVQNKGREVIWSCDPMHGNSKRTASGIKTRDFDEILFELRQSFKIHKKLGSYLGGVHFELTGDNVTECTGGARGLSEGDLHTAYQTLLDPRLNYEQALEMALLIIQQ